MYRVSFTGYRPDKLPFFGEDDPLCIELKRRIAENIYHLAEDGAREFYSGMALGIDMWCAEAVLELKKHRPEVRLTAMIPCPQQCDKWNVQQKRRYKDILAQCDQTICISPSYTSDCMHRRNRALVDICDVLLAVFDGRSGGTKYTVEYAQKKGRRVLLLPPV